jgi:hypothetical protein
MQMAVSAFEKPCRRFCRLFEAGAVYDRCNLFQMNSIELHFLIDDYANPPRITVLAYFSAAACFMALTLTGLDDVCPKDTIITPYTPHLHVYFDSAPKERKFL